MKSKVIFIGSFRKSAKDGSVGGQMFACSSLINSSLKNDIDFVLIDSTADSVPAPPLFRRLIKAINRVMILFHRLLDKKVHAVLIFSSAGFSLIEKGMMVFISKLFGKKVFFAPRSGLIKDNYSQSYFFRLFIPMIIRRSDVIICQGNAWKVYYQQISKESIDKFLVVPNWIDSAPYHKNNPTYPIRDTLTILYMGWLEGYKGIFDFIEAIQLLKKQDLVFHVKIGGMGSARTEMLNLIQHYHLQEEIEYVGWLTGEDKMKQFTETDIFVLPSHREGMPNVLMEAMASGIPVVATSVGGVPELIQNGINGFLVNSESPGELADAMAQLLQSSELRMKFSSQAKTFILENNSVEQVAVIFKKELLKHATV